MNLKMKKELSLDRFFTWCVNIGCASVSVCHRCLLSFRSHWPGSAGRNTASVKWDWGFIHCFLAYDFPFDHPGCAGWVAWLQGRFAMLWEEIKWDTGSKDLLSSSFKNCFYDFPLFLWPRWKGEMLEPQNGGGRYCCSLPSFCFQTSLRISLISALFHA